jgi:hypothetical protein
MGLSLSPITYKCCLRVLCPVRTMINLDCVLLKDNNSALVAKSGPEINSQACLCVLQRPCHITKCWLPLQHLIFLLMFCFETPQERLWSHKLQKRTIPCELVSNAISSHPSMPKDSVQPNSVPGTDVVQRLLHCRTIGDIVLAA